jgi:hypothetical protein
MNKIISSFLIFSALLLGSAFGQEAATAEDSQSNKANDSKTESQTTAEESSGWKVAIYPILVQAPIFGASVDLPSLPGSLRVISASSSGTVSCITGLRLRT